MPENQKPKSHPACACSPPTNFIAARFLRKCDTVNSTATVTPLAESPLKELLLKHPARELTGIARQVIEIAIDNTMTSCGYGVPVMQLVRNRRVADRGRRYKDPAAKPGPATA